MYADGNYYTTIIKRKILKIVINCVKIIFNNNVKYIVL